LEAKDSEQLLIVPAKKTYDFDHVFGPTATQQDVYTEIKPLVSSLLDGYNVCLMAYGQTGSGKTHSMEGRTQAPGITPQFLADVFQELTNNGLQLSSSDKGLVSGTCRVYLSVLEIYNETMYDLLPQKESFRKVDMFTTKQGMEIRNLNRYLVNS
jgi:kinesin family protein C2/C3